jgi:hypothetical protein
MERLQRAGVVLAFLVLGVVIVSLYGGFQTAIAQPIALIIGIAMGAVMIAIFLKVALVPERRYTGWVRSITNRNARWLFGFLLVAWVIGMAFLASLNLPVNTEGGPALLGLFAGFFIFMGFIWAVISE